MGFRTKTVVCRCRRAFAPAHLCWLVQARFYKYQPGRGEQEIFAPCELYCATVEIRRTRPRKGCRGGEHPCHVLIVANATGRSLHRQLIPVVGCKPPFRQQASTSALEEGTKRIPVDYFHAKRQRHCSIGGSQGQGHCL